MRAKPSTEYHTRTCVQGGPADALQFTHTDRTTCLIEHKRGQ